MNDTMRATDFFKAGLPDENIYRFEISSMRVKEYTNQDTQEKYSKILGSFVLQEAIDGHYDPRKKDRVSESFPLYGKSLRRLANLYKAIMGTTPVVTVNDKGEEVIDFAAIADELNGGIAWGALAHRKRQQKNDDGTYEDTDETDAKFGWSFADTPEGVRPSADLASRLGLG